MVRVIVPDSTSATRLVDIEHAAFEGREIPWTIDDFIAVGGPPDAAAIVDDGIREGFLILRMAADEAEILNFGVVPWARRKGLGRELLEAALILARELGIRSIFLEVAVDNAAALARPHADRHPRGNHGLRLWRDQPAARCIGYLVD